MSIVSGEPNWFILIIMNILEKLRIIPKPKEATLEEEKEFREMMKAKGFHFEEDESSPSF